jgi:hypothetical protein
MAGSYRHLVDENNQLHPERPGQPYPLIGDMRDAVECIDELFAMIQHLTGGDKAKIHEAWLEGYFKVNCPAENLPIATFDKFWKS